MAEEIITVAGDGITVSQLVWRRFRRRVDGMAEAVLTRNPGLAASEMIPVGTRVVLPDVPATAADPAVISLWD